jgi:hypothetical protein
MGKWLLRGVLGLAVVYGLFFSAVLAIMLRPPEQFGAVMQHLPQALVWGALPAPRMWLWARGGDLSEGDLAPDFDLSTHDRTGRVTLSSHRGQRPVVLVFGSYT